jgi:hypothetical protein
VVLCSIKEPVVSRRQPALGDYMWFFALFKLMWFFALRPGCFEKTAGSWGLHVVLCSIKDPAVSRRQPALGDYKCFFALSKTRLFQEDSRPLGTTHGRYKDF